MTAIGTFHGSPRNDFHIKATSLNKKTGSFMKKHTGLEQRKPGVDRLPHHADPSQMTTAGKPGFKPNLNDIQSDGDSQHSRPKTEDISVVVFAAHSGGKGLMAKRGTNVPVPVGSNRHADPCSAYKNAASAASIIYGRTNFLREIGIIDRFLRVAPKIKNRVSRLFKQRDEFFFETKPAMVTPQGNIQAFAPQR
jgi:hypothetical protein